jgi:hypothetical protein
MLSKNPYSSVDERPEYKAKQFFFRLMFLLPKVSECLLHRLSKPLLKGWWIKRKEFFVEFMNDFINHM